MIKAEYICHMGDDNLVCDAARVSFDKRASQYTEDQNAGLIRYLAAHKHTSPFTHPQITLRETVPIFVARQRFKHTVGFTYNEVSRRYVDEVPTMYRPDTWRKRPQGSVKQGSEGPHPKNMQFSESAARYEASAIDLYEVMISEGVAPEQARMVLPQSMMTSYFVTGSLAAFARAFIQRVDASAQIEIQQLAKQWGRIVEPLFPNSWYALVGEGV